MNRITLYPLLATLWLGACSPAPVVVPVVAPVAAWQMVMASPDAAMSILDSTGHTTPLPINGREPSWTPDGELIGVTPDRTQVFLADAQGGSVRQVGNLSLARIYKPQMARNGTIVFADFATNSVFVVQPDGSGLRKLVSPAAVPSISPDGSWVAYTVPGAHNEIWRISIDGTGARQLTFPTDPNAPDANVPAISPDGTQIAIYSGHELETRIEGGNVAVIPASGGARRNVTSCVLGGTPCMQADVPGWWPDGGSLVIDQASPAEPTGATYRVNLDGTGDTRMWGALRGDGTAPVMP